MFLDHLIMTFVVGCFAAPAILFNIARLEQLRPRIGPVFRVSVYEIFAFSLYFCKDIFLGQSAAKRILGFQVVNDRTGLPAGPLRCLVRNFTLFLWPVEAVVALVNVNRRLGDHIAGTRLVVYEPRPQEQVDWVAAVACIPLAMIFLYCICVLPMEWFMNLMYYGRE